MVRGNGRGWIVSVPTTLMILPIIVKPTAAFLMSRMDRDKIQKLLDKYEKIQDAEVIDDPENILYEKIQDAEVSELLVEDIKIIIDILRGYLKKTEWNPDPVRKEEGKFWYYDVTWSERNGPFDTYDEAEKACIEYCKRELKE